jgi:quercetin dioxygenase-like cupin family protein
MEIYNLKDFKGGWFIGNFEPSVLKTEGFEVGIMHHPSGQKWDIHTHKVAKEYNVVLQGQMRIQNTLLKQGDVFIIYPYELSDPEFLTDCMILVVKTPSLPGDKYCFQEVKK